MKVRIPKGFFNDHLERDLPAPEVIKQTKAHYWIDTDDQAFQELISDAKYYAGELGPDCCPGIRKSAKALLKAIALWDAANKRACELIDGYWCCTKDIKSLIQTGKAICTR